MRNAKVVSYVLLVVFALPAWAHSRTLKSRCSERSQSVTLTGSDAAGEGRIWNDERNGVRFWNYEGSNYEVTLNNTYKATVDLTLDQFACSDHFNFYYTNAGSDAVDTTYIEQVATQLEAAWTKFADRGFLTPLELQADGLYTPFSNFTRIPVLIFKTPNGKSGGNGQPNIKLIPGLEIDSRTPHHELFHVIKSGYTTFNPGWLNEGLARWSEKFVDGAPPPCGGLDVYNPATSTLFNKKYCDSAPFFEYLGRKYGRVYGINKGSDLVRAILEELSDLTAHSTSEAGMRKVELAVDSFRGGVASNGQSYKEWAKGNYVDDTGGTAVLRSGAPLRPRWTEAGEFGWGRDKYIWHDFAFDTRQRTTITIQIRAAAGDFVDDDGDDDDLRFRLDGALLGDWNSSNAIDGAELHGNTRTLHIVVPDVRTGAHTLRVEADEYPVLFSVNVFQGSVPLLLQRSNLFKWCPVIALGGPRRYVPCFSQDGDPAILSTTFEVPAGGISQATVVLEGRASSADQNEAGGYTNTRDDTKVLIDGIEMNNYQTESSLDGNYLDGQLGAAELRCGALNAGRHTLEILTRGKPQIDHVALFGTPTSPPLFRLVGGRLDSWSTNYHVIDVTRDMVPSDADVLAPGNLTIELGTYTWSHDLVPPFYYILLIDSSGNLVDTLAPEGHGVSRSITPQRLGRLGVGGRVVVVVGTAVPSGTYYLRVAR